MELVLRVTFAIIVAFAAINAVINFISYRNHREPIYKFSAWFWTSLIINFVLQGLAQNNILLILASFSFSIIPVNLLCLSLFRIMRKRFNFMSSLYLGIFATLSSLTLHKLGFAFFYCALPLAIALSYPLLLTSYFLFKTARNQRVFKLLGCVLFMLVVHSINFAIFRLDPTTQLWGWPVAYALYQAIAALLPAATLSEFHHRESRRMKAIIKSKTRKIEVSNQRLQNILSFKDFLFRTLAHDIATPLMISKASVDIFKKTNPPLNNEMNLARIERSIQKMIQITNDLRNLQSKQLEIEIHSVLSCMIEVEDNFKEMLSAKELKFTYNPQVLDGVGISVHRSTFINSVIGNLVRNSIKFSPRGQKISVDAGIEDENAWLSITNYGKAIPSNVIKSIFNFDSQTSKSGSEGETGTGWGLPICKVFMKNFDGSIEINSTETTDPSLAMIETRIHIKGSKIQPKLAKAV